MKKIAFVSIVLFASLILLQYVIVRPMMNTASSNVPAKESFVVQPVNYQITDSENVVIIYSNGQYFVYKKYLPST